jgi:hypothetical protein
MYATMGSFRVHGSCGVKKVPMLPAMSHSEGRDTESKPADRNMAYFLSLCLYR